MQAAHLEPQHQRHPRGLLPGSSGQPLATAVHPVGPAQPAPWHLPAADAAASCSNTEPPSGPKGPHQGAPTVMKGPACRITTCAHPWHKHLYMLPGSGLSARNGGAHLVDADVDGNAAQMRDGFARSRHGRPCVVAAGVVPQQVRADKQCLGFWSGEQRAPCWHPSGTF